MTIFIFDKGCNPRKIVQVIKSQTLGMIKARAILPCAFRWLVDGLVHEPTVLQLVGTSILISKKRGIL
jgi:hypothetical protein